MRGGQHIPDTASLERRIYKLINNHIFGNHLLEVRLCRVCLCEYIDTAGSVYVNISTRIVFKPQLVSSYMGKEENKRILLGLLKTDSFVFVILFLDWNCIVFSSLMISFPFLAPSIHSI